MTLENIEHAASQLSRRERAALAHSLLKGLDDGVDEDVEAIWIEESERRLDAYLRGEMEAVDGDQAMAQLYNRLK